MTRSQHGQAQRGRARHRAAAARTDADLVVDFLAGDSAALGDLYDRFAPGLYDTSTAMLRDRDGAADVVQDVFCVAATKLGQLRDPARVKPWLYAIARHEIFRRTKQRSRSTSLDALGDDFGMTPTACPDPHAEGAVAESRELASLIRDAAVGLDPTDQLLLELTSRQGLVGAELAAAIGVPVAKAHSMTFRMRERLERAVGAVVVTRGGRKRCEDLAAVLTGWDGRFDVLWRKRISRHIDDCATCQDTRKGAGVLSMAGLAPAFALPSRLRQRTLATALGGSGGPGGDVAAARYGFDADGFPLLGRHRSTAGRSRGDGLAARSLPVAVAATMVAALVITLGMITLTPPTIDGSVSDEAVSAVALGVESTATDSSADAATTSTSSSTTSTTATATSTTVPAIAPPTIQQVAATTAAPPLSVAVAPPPTFATTPRPTTSEPAMALPRTTTTLPPTTTSTARIATSPSPPRIRSVAMGPTTLASCGVGPCSSEE